MSYRKIKLTVGYSKRLKGKGHKLSCSATHCTSHTRRLYINEQIVCKVGNGVSKFTRLYHVQCADRLAIPYGL